MKKRIVSARELDLTKTTIERGCRVGGSRFYQISLPGTMGTITPNLLKILKILRSLTTYTATLLYESTNTVIYVLDVGLKISLRSLSSESITMVSK